MAAPAMLRYLESERAQQCVRTNRVEHESVVGGGMVVRRPISLLAGGGAVVEQPTPLVVAKQKTTYIHMAFVWHSYGQATLVRRPIPLLAGGGGGGGGREATYPSVGGGGAVVR